MGVASVVTHPLVLGGVGRSRTLLEKKKQKKKNKD
jgi:hypothetical protein